MNKSHDNRRQAATSQLAAQSYDQRSNAFNLMTLIHTRDSDVLECDPTTSAIVVGDQNTLVANRAVPRQSLQGIAE